MTNYHVARYGRAIVLTVDAAAFGDHNIAIAAGHDSEGTGVLVSYVPAARDLAKRILDLCPEDESEAGSGGSAGRGTVDSPNASIDGDHTAPGSGGVEGTIEVL